VIHRVAKFIALVFLASCAREATIRDVPVSQPAATTTSPGNASSTVSRTPDTSKQILDSVIGDAEDESVPPMEDSIAFSCTPKSLRPHDTLTLQFDTPHGGELMLLTPGDVFFSFVYPSDDRRQTYSIVRSEDFRTMSTLKVPADIRLPPAVYGRDTIPEPVFSRPGQYELRMGDKLESDHTGPPYACMVMFAP
jgi:hypothetical protein